MKYSNVYLTDMNGEVILLSEEFDNLNQLRDALEDASNAEDLLKRLERTEHTSTSLILDRDSFETIRIKCIGGGSWITTIRFLVIKHGT